MSANLSDFQVKVKPRTETESGRQDGRSGVGATHASPLVLSGVYPNVTWAVVRRGGEQQEENEQSLG